MYYLKKYKIFFSSILIILLMSSSNASWADIHKLYTIQNIKVDQSAHNAAMAREHALIEARRKAWDSLVHRIIPSSHISSVPSLKDQDILNFLQDYHFLEEKNSPTRYVAELTFHFNPLVVRQFLLQKKIPFSEIPGPKLLVLPVLAAGQEYALWDDRNIWLEAWKKGGYSNQALEYIIPYSNVRDERLLPVEKVIQGDKSALEAIQKAYGADDIILAVAGFKKTQPSESISGSSETISHVKRLKVQVFPFHLTQKTEGIEMYIGGENQEVSNETLLQYAIKNVVDYLDEEWKSKNLDASKIESSIRITVPAESLEHVEKIMRKISSLDAVEKIVPVKMQKSQFTLKVYYRGTEASIVKSLDILGGQLKKAQESIELEQIKSVTAPKTVWYES